MVCVFQDSEGLHRGSVLLEHFFKARKRHESVLLANHEESRDLEKFTLGPWLVSAQNVEIQLTFNLESHGKDGHFGNGFV